MRNTSQILQIVYGAAGQTGGSKGGFFPNGLNGNITTSQLVLHFRQESFSKWESLFCCPVAKVDSRWVESGTWLNPVSQNRDMGTRIFAQIWRLPHRDFAPGV
jgi:hypothetical protein